MKAFLTGATGFIGATIARELLSAGYCVKALVRSDSDHRNLTGLDIEPVIGELRDLNSIKRAMAGCEQVFHAAADYRLWTRTPAEMYDINVGGTRNIMEAALSSGVTRVVYTSSVGTLGNPGTGLPGTETTPVTFADMVGDYKKSKFLAEREAETFIPRGLPLIIVNPSTPVGPWDIKPTPTGKIIVDFLNRKMPAYLETGLNIIDVRDCARGHLLAAQKGQIGRKYILGNEDLTLAGFFRILAEITGQPAPRVRLPYLPVLMGAYVSTAMASLTGREPLIPLAGVQMARKYMFFDSSRAVNELGLPQRPVREALTAAVEWFETHGYGRKPRD